MSPGAVNLVIGLLRLSTRPQDLPASRGLLVAALLAMTLADALGLASGAGVTLAVLAGALDAALLSGFVLLVLRVRGFSSRIWQTLPALALIGAALSLLAQLVVTLVPSREIAAVLWWVVLGWYLAASGNVLRHALEMAWHAGIVVSLLYLLFYWSVLQLLLGNPPSAAP